MFGPTGYDLLKDHLVRMIQSNSAEEFDSIYNLGRMLFENQMQKNGQLMSDFETFANNKSDYAEYCIAQLPGNRGRKGSAISESNHSSVLSYLNGLQSWSYVVGESNAEKRPTHE